MNMHLCLLTTNEYIMHEVCLGRFPADGNQVAPGMSCLYNIRFVPDSMCDYTDQLTVETLTSPIHVPIHARRPPPVLTRETWNPFTYRTVY